MLLHHKSYSGLSVIHEVVVLKNKWPKCLLKVQPPNDFALCLSVCLFQRHLESINHYLHKDFEEEKKLIKEKSKEEAFAFFLGCPTGTI